MGIPNGTALRPALKVGDRHENWTVIQILGKLDRNNWVKCQCICGCTKETPTKGFKKSKGCRDCWASRQREDLAGRTFGKLTVISYAGRNRMKSDFDEDYFVSTCLKIAGFQEKHVKNS